MSRKERIDIKIFKSGETGDKVVWINPVTSIDKFHWWLEQMYWNLMHLQTNPSNSAYYFLDHFH